MSRLWRPQSSPPPPSRRCHSLAHDLPTSQPLGRKGGAVESDFGWAPCRAALRFTACPHFSEKETDTPRSSGEARIRTQVCGSKVHAFYLHDTQLSGHQDGATWGSIWRSAESTRGCSYLASSLTPVPCFPASSSQDNCRTCPQGED